MDRNALEMWSLAQNLLANLAGNVDSLLLSVLLQYTCVHPVQMAKRQCQGTEWELQTKFLAKGLHRDCN